MLWSMFPPFSVLAKYKCVHILIVNKSIVLSSWLREAESCKVIAERPCLYPPMSCQVWVHLQEKSPT